MAKGKKWLFPFDSQFLSFLDLDVEVRRAGEVSVDEVLEDLRKSLATRKLDKCQINRDIEFVKRFKGEKIPFKINRIHTIWEYLSLYPYDLGRVLYIMSVLEDGTHATVYHFYELDNVLNVVSNAIVINFQGIKREVERVIQQRRQTARSVIVTHQDRYLGQPPAKTKSENDDKTRSITMLCTLISQGYLLEFPIFLENPSFFA